MKGYLGCWTLLHDAKWAVLLENLSWSQQLTQSDVSALLAGLIYDYQGDVKDI